MKKSKETKAKVNENNKNIKEEKIMAKNNTVETNKVTDNEVATVKATTEVIEKVDDKKTKKVKEKKENHNLDFVKPNNGYTIEEVEKVEDYQRSKMMKKIKDPKTGEETENKDYDNDFTKSKKRQNALSIGLSTLDLGGAVVNKLTERSATKGNKFARVIYHTTQVLSPAVLVKNVVDNNNFRKTANLANSEKCILNTKQDNKKNRQKLKEIQNRSSKAKSNKEEK